MSQKAGVERLVVQGSAEALEAVRAAAIDICDAGSIEVIDYVEASTDAADNVVCTVTLAPAP